MKYGEALALFDAMSSDQKINVTRIFELICNETGFPNVRDAFSAAVDDEAKAIETKMLLQHEQVQ